MLPALALENQRVIGFEIYPCHSFIEGFAWRNQNKTPSECLTICYFPLSFQNSVPILI
jgi:hypothetical protein